jgi:hypothetical protein
MGVYEAAENRVLIILADDTALCFTDEAQAMQEVAQRRVARLGAFIKSFLPKVSKVAPVEAVLQGRRVAIIAPPAFN